MPLKLPSFRARRNAYPPDLWTKCPDCEEMLFNKQLDKALRVCPNCGHHFRLSAAARLDQLLDPGSWVEHDAGLLSVDRLGFVDSKSYVDRLAAAQLSTVHGGSIFTPFINGVAQKTYYDYQLVDVLVSSV